MAQKAMLQRQKPLTEEFQFGPWTLIGVKSHILMSEGEERHEYEANLKLPQLPEMVYDKNRLEIKHSSGFSIEFNALDALKLVDPEHDLIKVSATKEWQEARSNCEFIKEVVKPFDWTFTTNYMGTLVDPTKVLKISETKERIDMEKLKSREKIHFFQDILLFEDELSDNGDSTLNVKVRVMPASFFILLRQYMRVDDVLVRINDTRLYHEAGWGHILREFTTRESQIKNLQVPLNVVIDKNEIWQHLPTKVQCFHKIEFPSSSCDMNIESDQVKT